MKPLKELAFYYSITGDYTEETQRLEDEYVNTNRELWKKEWDVAPPEEKEFFWEYENYEGFHIGMWQADNGFTRESCYIFPENEIGRWYI